MTADVQTITLPRIVTPKPGIYPKATFEEYCSWDAANSHLLNVFSKTAAHVRHEMLSGEGERSRAKDLGWLVHLAVLEPERFEREIAVPPKLRKQGKRNLEIWAQWEADNAGKLPVTQAILDKALAMRDAVLAHETAGEFFRSQGHAELSVAWEERQAGVLCKARLDKLGRIGTWPILGDLKTAADAGRRAFESAIYRFGYHVQAAHYLAGVEAVAPVPAGNPYRRFVFFVVESDEPYAVACYEPDDLALAAGERSRQAYLRRWRECVETDRWDGYPAGVELASIPAWATKQWSSEGE